MPKKDRARRIEEAYNECAIIIYNYAQTKDGYLTTEEASEALRTNLTSPVPRDLKLDGILRSLEAGGFAKLKKSLDGQIIGIEVLGCPCVPGYVLTKIEKPSKKK